MMSVYKAIKRQDLVILLADISKQSLERFRFSKDVKGK